METKKIDVPLGGILTAEDGRRFECASLVRAKQESYCAGCDFIQCNYGSMCRSVECNARSRADRRYVIFKEVKQ